ncbi:hypothetical protein Q8A67_005300 [Cirrhinus molitorella]|uniref:Immunoglobulin V-set domain-containing protein n=1 Tax=Cirrhinus molitorella TaxID=172907 RepID=A0AA88QD80_9TELE|nr:hypothetical protein Q8A67_005300 [Cirrhinus molitorella]
MICVCDDKLLVFNLLLLMSVVACEMKEVLNFTAHERGTVKIQCPYVSKYKKDKKYLCRGECPRVNKDKVVESGSATQDDRFSLTDNKTAHVFTVTITDLRTEDQGKYWCGIKTGWGKKDDFTQIYLEIKHTVRVRGVIHVLAKNLPTKEETHSVCHYEEIICTDSYGLGLPVFGAIDPYDPHLTYSTTVLFQTTDHSEIYDSATVSS